VAQINHERHNQLSIMDLLRRPSMRMRFLIGFITMFGYQCTGTQVINSKLLTASLSSKEMSVLT